MTMATVNAVCGSSRRDGLQPADIRLILEHRGRSRPTPWAAIARMLGRCEADLKQHFEPQGENQ